MYRTEVKTATLPVEVFLRDYCDRERFLPCCEVCPEYHSNWACPPGVPAAEDLLRGLSAVTLVGVQVVYDNELRERAADGDSARKAREETYDVAKRQLNATMLALESVCPNGVVIAAGSCKWCDRCARLDGQPCRDPARCRYSFSALGFDLGKLAKECLKVELLWDKGLPEYDVLMAALVQP